MRKTELIREKPKIVASKYLKEVCIFSINIKLKYSKKYSFILYRGIMKGSDTLCRFYIPFCPLKIAKCT